MTALLEYRGPAAKHIWVQGQVGLGHTLFRTTYESAPGASALVLRGRLKKFK